MEESIIEATQSLQTLIEKIDDENKSVLKELSINMSRTSIECDLIRI